MPCTLTGDVLLHCWRSYAARASAGGRWSDFVGSAAASLAHRTYARRGPISPGAGHRTGDGTDHARRRGRAEGKASPTSEGRETNCCTKEPLTHDVTFQEELQRGKCGAVNSPANHLQSVELFLGREGAPQVCGGQRLLSQQGNLSGPGQSS